MSKKLPLAVRLYFHPPLAELARLIGYDELPLPEAKEKLKPLAEKYGKQTMEQAAREIVSIDVTTDPPLVRLTEEVRKACWQLLGAPPGQKEARSGQ